MVSETTILHLGEGGAPDRLERTRFQLRDAATGVVLFDGVEATVGSQAACDVVLTDATVSRYHCVIETRQEGFVLRDLGSLNGTRVEGVRVKEAHLEPGMRIGLGESGLLFGLASGQPEVAELPPEESFHGLYGRSPSMRRIFALMRKVAPSDATVLLSGETGTGKEAAAEAIHAQSRRGAGPLVVIDCGAIPANLLESELFGHRRGAFTGAISDRKGAFETANGGTILLDEIGELPVDLQPKLLRVLESRTVRRLGETERRPIDVRMLAASHRDLRRMVNEGRFRADLFYRLAVVTLELPPLRERLDDLELLVPAFLERLGASPEERARWTRAGFLSDLRRSDWPGNLRELRNHLERCVVLGSAVDPTPLVAPGAVAGTGLPPTTLTWAAAREQALEGFEREWLRGLLERCEGNVSRAAREADMNRAYLHRLLGRHGLR